MEYYTNGDHSANLLAYRNGAKPRIYIGDSDFLATYKTTGDVTGYGLNDAIIGGHVDMSIGTHAQLGGVVTSELELKLAKNLISDNIKNQLFHKNSANKLYIYFGIGAEQETESVMALDDFFTVIETPVQGRDTITIHGYGGAHMLDTRFDPSKSFDCLNGETLINYLNNTHDGTTEIIACIAETAGIACRINFATMYNPNYEQGGFFETDKNYTCRDIVEWFCEYYACYASVVMRIEYSHGESDYMITPTLEFNRFDWTGNTDSYWQVQNIINMDVSRLDIRCCGICITYKGTEYYCTHPSLLSDNRYNNVYVRIKNDANIFYKLMTWQERQNITVYLYGDDQYKLKTTPAFKITVASGFVYEVGQPRNFIDHEGVQRSGCITHVTYNFGGTTLLECDTGFGNI